MLSDIIMRTYIHCNDVPTWTANNTLSHMCVRACVSVCVNMPKYNTTPYDNIRKIVLTAVLLYTGLQIVAIIIITNYTCVGISSESVSLFDSTSGGGGVNEIKLTQFCREIYGWAAVECWCLRRSLLTRAYFFYRHFAILWWYKEARGLVLNIFTASSM